MFNSGKSYGTFGPNWQHKQFDAAMPRMSANNSIFKDQLVESGRSGWIPVTWRGLIDPWEWKFTGLVSY